MATAEVATVAVEIPAVDPVAPETPAAADAPRAKPEKVKKAPGARKPAAHPPYLEMISEAITSLKERTGSSQYAISKFIKEKHKAHLAGNFKKLLLVQLRKLTADGKLTKVKNSYKVFNNRFTKPVAKKPVTASTEPSSDTGDVAPAKPKPVIAKLKKATTKQKPKVAESAKPAGPKKPVQAPKESKSTADNAAPAKPEPVAANLKKKTTMKKSKPAGSAKPKIDTLKEKNADAVKPKAKRAAPKPKTATQLTTGSSKPKKASRLARAAKTSSESSPIAGEVSKNLGPVDA